MSDFKDRDAYKSVLAQRVAESMRKNAPKPEPKTPEPKVVPVRKERQVRQAPPQPVVVKQPVQVAMTPSTPERERLLADVAAGRIDVEKLRDYDIKQEQARNQEPTALTAAGKGGGGADQPRWPKGTPVIGGRWKGAESGGGGGTGRGPAFGQPGWYASKGLSEESQKRRGTKHINQTEVLESDDGAVTTHRDPLAATVPHYRTDDGFRAQLDNVRDQTGVDAIPREGYELSDGKKLHPDGLVPELRMEGAALSITTQREIAGKIAAFERKTGERLPQETHDAIWEAARNGLKASDFDDKSITKGKDLEDLAARFMFPTDPQQAMAMDVPQSPRNKEAIKNMKDGDLWHDGKEGVYKGDAADEDFADLGVKNAMVTTHGAVGMSVPNRHKYEDALKTEHAPATSVRIDKGDLDRGTVTEARLGNVKLDKTQLEALNKGHSRILLNSQQKRLSQSIKTENGVEKGWNDGKPMSDSQKRDAQAFVDRLDREGGGDLHEAMRDFKARGIRPKRAAGYDADGNMKARLEDDPKLIEGLSQQQADDKVNSKIATRYNVSKQARQELIYTRSRGAHPDSFITTPALDSNGFIRKGVDADGNPVKIKGGDDRRAAGESIRGDHTMTPRPPSRDKIQAKLIAADPSLASKADRKPEKLKNLTDLVEAISIDADPNPNPVSGRVGESSNSTRKWVDLLNGNDRSVNSRGERMSNKTVNDNLTFLETHKIVTGHAPIRKLTQITQQPGESADAFRRRKKRAQEAIDKTRENKKRPPRILTINDPDLHTTWEEGTYGDHLDR